MKIPMKIVVRGSDLETHLQSLHGLQAGTTEEVLLVARLPRAAGHVTLVDQNGSIKATVRNLQNNLWIIYGLYMVYIRFTYG